MKEQGKMRRGRVGPLEQIADIKREAGRLYKAARQKAGSDIDPATAYRLAQVLNVVKGCIVDHESVARLQAGLAALEELRGSAKPGKPGLRAVS
jgi:hypothetical protein